MFFIHIMGRHSRKDAAKTLTGLGKKVAKEMADRANDSISVSVGKDENAVMPYAWITRDRDNDDMWVGATGDYIRLGIDSDMLQEKDPVNMVFLNEAIDQVIMNELQNLYQEGPKQITPKKSELSEDEKNQQATKMVQDLFANLKKGE